MNKENICEKSTNDFSDVKIIKQFADNVRKKRLECNLTQQELADRCKMHVSYISAIEKYRINISLKNLQIIAKALKVEPKTLIS